MTHVRDRALAVRPVARRAAPRYPSFEAFARDPARLLRYVPPRWRRCRLAFGALAAFALGRLASAQGAAPPAAQPQTERPAARPRTERAPAPQTLVAPVFVHGEGRGATGCVVVSPPVFLSEAEALEILWDELGGAGLGFEPQAHAAGLASKADESPFVYDFWSPALRLGVAFVGEHNYGKLAGHAANASLNEDGSIAGYSTVGDYDTLALAQSTAERLREAHGESAGVLYDPLVSIAFDRDEGRSQARRAREQARRLLRAQIRDFVAWARKTLQSGASR